jgi:site-specific DNA recombinase
MLASERVQEALPPKLADELASAMATRKLNRVPTSRQSLLGGLASCGTCGRPMNLSSTRGGRRGGRWAQYRCSQAGHVGISGPWLEEYVSSRIIDVVDTTKLVAELRSRHERGERRNRAVSDLEARLELLDDMLVNAKITKARYERMNAELLNKLADARHEERDNRIDLPAELARDLGARWDDLEVTTRRGIIRAVLRDIVVNKAKGHGSIVGEDRVRLVWRLN